MRKRRPRDEAIAEAERGDRRRLRVCLAASGGGHLRQLLDLEPVWSRHDYHFVTEDTALGRSLGDEHPVAFVAHYGWGQAKLGAPLKMLRGAVANLVSSIAIVARHRPEVVITTGAAAVFFTVLLARVLGAQVIVIESFARFEHASLFGRMTSRIASAFVVQSAQLARHYPRAQFFDPLKRLEGVAPPKQPLLFATVGAILPFDRLVSAVAEVNASGDIEERILIQTGAGGVRPSGLDVVESLPFSDLQTLLRDASVVVCHGGTGSIITALREGCHVIAMPRLQRLGEVYDDHQAEIVEAFEARGLVLSAHDADGLRRALAMTKTRERVLATTDPVALRNFLDEHLSARAARGK